ncbi:MAG: inositol monophosphatase, partial [Verrucomicrobiae bacterium]|nr:inositol monophosphatase [Verrucomicrobiae bacterium]
MHTEEKEKIRRLLCSLGDVVQAFVLEQRHGKTAEELASVSAVSSADTIYSVDKFSEQALLDWFANHWPETLPVEVIAEGLE